MNKPEALTMRHNTLHQRRALPTDAQAAYDSALAMLHTGQGDPMARVGELLRTHPEFVGGHCLRVALLVMASREDAQTELAHALDHARALPAGLASERERRHLDAADAWLARDLKRALQLYGDIVTDYPHDTLALRVAHFGDLQWGRTEQLRDRVAAVLPHWHAGIPGYGHVLGMYAFGLAEAGEHARAEQVGRRALVLSPDNAGAIHAVAHAIEMQGRAADGIAWLQETRPIWEHSSYGKHLWWHLALFHLDLGDVPAALQIHDRRLRAHAGLDIPAMVDASALLWRLHLRGVDVDGRWQALADRWAAQPLAGLRPFNDTHAMLAYVGAGRPGLANWLVHELRASALRSHDLDEVIYQAALPICDALLRFGAGDYAAAAAGILQYRHLTERCGGSRAQCDLLHLTLLEAAVRSGQMELARSLAAERRALRPRSRFNRCMKTRIDRVSAMAATRRSQWVSPVTGAVQPQLLAAGLLSF
jgi:tetratricopeptide (TPR) repeat protein